MTEILANFVWVDDTDGALNLIKQLKDSADYAIDTEFERTRTFYLNPAVLQIKCNDQFFLVDISIAEIAALIMKPIKGLILHSGSEDLELWHQVTQQKPGRVFDTQVAAALAGYSLHTSYLNLVQELMGVELDKAMSRSDWLARPLTEEQIKYAIEDIVYLEEFKAILSDKVESRGLTPLFNVLMQQMIDNIETDRHNEKLYQKLVKAERLKADEADRLWLILNWRDAMAKQRNKPRNWILKPPQIVSIIRKVKHFSDLFHLGLHPNFVKHQGYNLIKALYSDDESLLQQKPALIRLNSQQGTHLSEMKQRLKQVTDRLGIDPSIIINVADLKKLAFEGKELADLPTWRALS